MIGREEQSLHQQIFLIPTRTHPGTTRDHPIHDLTEQLFDSFRNKVKHQPQGQAACRKPQQCSSSAASTHRALIEVQSPTGAAPARVSLTPSMIFSSSHTLLIKPNFSTAPSRPFRRVWVDLRAFLRRFHSLHVWVERLVAQGWHTNR